jgi:hypothetical protein
MKFTSPKPFTQKSVDSHRREIPTITERAAPPLAVEDRTLDALDFYNRTEAAWTKNNALRVPLESSYKGRYC